MTHMLLDIAGLPVKRVLVIVAHPDDIESWCGGVVARFTALGKEVAYVLCTSGDKGSNDPTQTPQQVGARREAEQLEAACILGVERVAFLRWPDSEVEPTLALRRELVRQVRLHRPDLVITHDPAPPYRQHPDHRAVGRATLDALFPCARDPLTFAEQITEEGLQAHTVPEAWLFASEVPDIWIDIASTLAQKVQARLAHASQHTDPAELERNWYRRAATVGEAQGLRAAEAFKRIDLR